MSRTPYLCAKLENGVSSGSFDSASSAFTNCGRSLAKLSIRSLSIKVCIHIHQIEQIESLCQTNLITYLSLNALILRTFRVSTGLENYLTPRKTRQSVPLHDMYEAEEIETKAPYSLWTGRAEKTSDDSEIVHHVQ